MTSARDQLVTELADFIDDYMKLLLGQIDGVKAEMKVAVDDVMDGLSEISSAQVEKTKMAQSILLESSIAGVQPTAGSHFQEVTADERAKAENQVLASREIDLNQSLTTGVKKGGSELRSYMESLGALDHIMQDNVMTMVGAMSADDVVGQRLDHVCTAIELLRDELIQVVRNMNNPDKSQNVKSFSDQLNSKVYRTYTMQDERKVFKRIHGYDPTSKGG